MHNEKCYAAHVGVEWMIEAAWFQAAVSAIKAGTWKPQEGFAAQAGPGVVIDPATASDKYPKVFYYLADGVATVPMNGPMMKVDSKYGGVNTVRSRMALRHAVANDAVSSVMLQIDSPGGTVAGTSELAAEVKALDAVKPVFAQIEDLGASAAYWVASQARKVFANTMAQIGSIGTVAVITDMSKAAEMQGVKVHVLSTGDYKGAGTPGSEITDKHLAYFQERVDDLNEHFLKAVKTGRGLGIEDVRKLADGRVHISSKALAMGLIDGVQDASATVKMLAREVKAAKGTDYGRRVKAQLEIEGAE